MSITKMVTRTDKETYINPFDEKGEINPEAFTKIAPPGFLSHTGKMWMSEDFNDPL